MEEKFNVVIYFPGDTYEYVKNNVSAKEAMNTVKDYVNRPATLIGIIQKIMITDTGDCCCFLWENGQIVFPPAF